MIVDCHTHIWARPDQLGPDAEAYLARQCGDGQLAASPAGHTESAKCVAKTLVLGFVSRRMSAEVPNDYLAEYVAGHDDRMIGAACVDPAEPGAVDEAETLISRREFRAITLSPAAQHFHPADSRAMRLYELAEAKSVPIIFQQGVHFPIAGRMEYARPALLDEIACEFADLTIVISSLGYPWVNEGIALLGKHPRVFADTAGLLNTPWQAYSALLSAHQFNVMDKVLFGSGFPYLTAAQAIETIYRLGELTQGTNLPAVPREALRSVVERDALAALGIALASEQVTEEAVEDE